ncbi:MAG: hypothetical protein KatS3mg108_3357 [Isosphaeraceae bacterium]|jgi:aspartyl-tRNA(Asn)/glutamyl-tRNA(Gln) amidotransferase subunit A|nr:MAG: hypothetical protein KatS3mg108_3357 [Isosphaeraceae bacterium]
MTEDALAFAPLPVLGSALRSGSVTSAELTRLFLDRLERWGKPLNCVVTVTRELGLDQARRADAELAAGVDRGPLHGIPYGVKDLLATPGIVTSWGAAPYRDRVIEEEATVVARLREAGAVLVAKLAMVELAGGMGYRQPNASFTGPGLNPWDRTRWSGGSSSGSGAAVAAGLVPFAIGTETWGSITTPSSYCGVTGLRPTYGRVSRAGAMALAWTHDKIGPIARTAHDCGLVLCAIAGPDRADRSAADRPYRYPPADAPGRPFRLGVVRGAVEKAHPDVRRHFERALGVLRGLGTVEEVDLPEGPWADVAVTIISAENAAAHEELIDSGRVAELTAPEDRIGGYGDTVILATEYLRALRIREILARRLDAFYAPFDAVVSVPTPGPATPADASHADRYEAPSLGAHGNLCGTPAVCVPTGRTEDGLPTAMQLDGRAWSENRLLAVAIAFQQQTGWHLDHPVLS